jgi:DNA-binding XRE family transcriptional regulator
MFVLAWHWHSRTLHALDVSAGPVYRLHRTSAEARDEPALMTYRRWRSISRDDLAEKSGIAKEDIEAIEDGNKDIEEEMLESLSTVLNVPQDQLI